MPPRKRAETEPAPLDTTEDTSGTEATPDSPAPAAKRRKADPEVCPACFPNGWPGNAEAVGCEHGSWTRN